MNILVTNDDGINADGLWALVRKMKDIGNVTVVAPDREQSGVGTSISFHAPVRLTRINGKIDEVVTYTVEGTPADCVIMAIKVAIPDKIDLLVSGINQGPNCGYDVFISGTVGAALQGYFYDIPSLAVSMSSFNDPKFDVGARVAAEVAQYVIDNHRHGKLLLNINVPDISLDQMTGIQVTTLGEKIYSAGIKTGNDGRRDYYWIIHSATDSENGKGTDLQALKNLSISVTPLQFAHNSTDIKFTDKMIPVISRNLFGNKFD